MEVILSVFFNSDRTYFCVTEQTKKGLNLIDIDSTEKPVKFDLKPEKLIEFALEIDSKLGDYRYNITQVNVTLPADNVIVTQFPGSVNISREEHISLLNFEIRQLYPQYNYENFQSEIIPLTQLNNKNEMLLAVIISRQDLKAVAKIFAELNLNIDNVEISQFNVHNSFLYNYPEKSSQTVVFLGFQNQFIDISILSDGKLAYYNLDSWMNVRQISSAFTKEFDRIFSAFTGNIDAAYFFGSGLTDDFFNLAKNSLIGKIPEIQRLNAFRMVTTDLNQRTRDYCSRVSHIVSPCIGGCLPTYQEGIRI